MEIQEYKLEKLIYYLDNFQNDYEMILKLSNDIDDINNLGSMIDYPFHKPLDKIDVKNWIINFKRNIKSKIDNEN